jgi:trimeric autotransporter adhesin
MNYLKTKIAVVLILVSLSSRAQVGIGTPTPEAELDITSSNDGLLIPRVALTTTSSALPLTTPTVSELVYNSATVADVTPGYYYWNGTIWIRLAAGITNDWSTTGNTGIVNGTNFIGTAALTNIDVAFRRNNFPAGKISATSTSFGVGALNAGAATNSTAFGNNALTLNTGANNVAVGNGTLAANVTGIQNTGVGNASLAVSTGSASTAIGFEALKANTTGNNGTAVGFQALSKNTGASNNTAIGFQTMLNNTTGSENTAVGFQTSSIGATGSKNTAMGFIALNNNTGSENTAYGHSSLSGINNNASRFNTAIGFQSMFAGIGNVSNVVAVGANALFQNTASNTVGIGFNALQGQGGGGTGNTGIGFSVLNNNTTGDNNTAVGSEAGFAAVGSGNTLIGFRAGQFASNATGAGTFVGFQAGQGTTGANNTAVGNNALVATGASANNVAVGNNSLSANTSTNNTAVGFSSLVANNGTGNVAIGHQAGFSETGSNKLYISNSNTTATTSLLYGEFSPTRILRTNSVFQIGDPATTGFVFPTTRGTINQYLTTNATGVLSWTAPDALPNSTLSVARNNLIATQTLAGTGWEKILFDTEDFDTNAELASSTFTATKAGIYQVNAGYHTNGQANTQFYSIGIYINGVLSQKVSANHFNNGPVSRLITNTFSLIAGNTIEVFVENYIPGALLDNTFGKAFFEITQIR